MGRPLTHIYKYKQYAHFDYKKHFKKLIPFIQNPANIVQHGFFPFIHYVMSFHKFSKDGGRVTKKRHIYYSAHIDRYIYEYYAYFLNEKYNEFAKKCGTNQCTIAYRNILHKNNIHFARDVFDYLRSKEGAHIIVGDFKDFFDSLDHMYLKEQLKVLLEQRMLSDDIYKVFRSITKYSFVEIEDILVYKKIENTKELNKLDRIMSTEELRQFKKKHLKQNPNNFGIPQGSAISAVLSNIYMMDVDTVINRIITQEQGLYRRYCDDFIIVLPCQDEYAARHLWLKVKGIFDCVPGVQLHPDKTVAYQFAQNKIIPKSSIILGKPDCAKERSINYLGLNFNGYTIAIREKTIGKFYYRMYKKVDAMKKQQKRTGKIIPRKKLYKSFLFHEVKRGKFHSGNFLNYIDRAQTILNDKKLGQIKSVSQRKLHLRLKR